MLYCSCCRLQPLRAEGGRSGPRPDLCHSALPHPVERHRPGYHELRRRLLSLRGVWPPLAPLQAHAGHPGARSDRRSPSGHLLPVSFVPHVPVLRQREAIRLEAILSPPRDPELTLSPLTDGRMCYCWIDRSAVPPSQVGGRQAGASILTHPPPTRAHHPSPVSPSRFAKGPYIVAIVGFALCPWNLVNNGTSHSERLGIAPIGYSHLSR
jgi:hypothetical protein